MYSFNNWKQSFKEWSPRVVRRWWGMMFTLMSFVPLVVSVIVYVGWARDVEPPLPIWNILLFTGGVLLFFVVSFLAFHRVRIERDELKEQLDKTIIKSDLEIGAKVKSIITAGYYDKAFGGYPEGDRQVVIDMILKPSKPMTLDIVALELWGGRLDAKIQREIAPFDLKLLAPMPLSRAQPYTFTLTCNVPKQFAFDTEDAYIFVLADGLEQRSKPFTISFGEENGQKHRP